MTRRIVLAYSGGVQSLAAIRSLSERDGAEVVTVTVDIGQGADLAGARERALEAGAVRSHVIDAREALAGEIVAAVLKAGALSDGRYPMATGMGRPVLAARVAEVARLEGTTLVAHAASGRDRVRMDALLRGIEPALEVIAIAGEHGLSRADLVAYAGADADPPRELGRADQNLWGRTTGRLELDPALEVPDAVFVRTRPLARCPDRPALLAVAFERGVPVGLNGVRMSMVEIVESLATIAGEHGVGRLDRVKYRPDGSRARVVYEAPAAVVLHRAHLEMLRFVCPGPVIAFSRTAASVYADLIGTGQWFAPLRRALDAFVDRANEPATGTVHVRLFKGNCEVVGRSVERS